MNAYVILPAAGLGTRMVAGQQAKPGTPKQFLSLAGVPILIHTLRAFSEVRGVRAIYVAVRAPELERMRDLVEEYGLSSDHSFYVRVVEGGDTRQESVASALRQLAADQPPGDDSPDPTPPDPIILVHDAVRPLITPDLIERTIEAATRHGAAIVGLPATDTIKQVERTAHGARVTATIPRECIVQAQTPQGFRASILKRAFAEAEADGFCGTDEASLVERAGVEVYVVPGSLANMKITQPGDLELAEFFLSRVPRPVG
jgi:2-C-methyl-D-erythritol 4-phosphate cytidylyltransferase